MASTSNRNTAGDYAQDQHQMLRIRQYDMFRDRMYHPSPALPGDGLGSNRRMPRETLAHNACDVESFLFGIRTTDLVDPKPPLAMQPIAVPSLSIMDRIPVILPDPIAVPKYQRPFP
jgi:hypothetical protein